jgi:NADPH:quinone reductase-like Zn-dependent oxidoreductase
MQVGLIEVTDAPLPSLQVDVKHGSGPASALFINHSTAIPEMRSGECLVRVKAFGINRGDMLQREGKYPGISHLTKIIGLEFSGIIARTNEVAIGTNTTNAQEGINEWRVGDEVFGLLYRGGYGMSSSGSSLHVVLALSLCVL